MGERDDEEDAHGREAACARGRGGPAEDAGRAARLASALRENLRRRKAQSKARRPAAGTTPGDERED
jgi:hypothetical protein